MTTVYLASPYGFSESTSSFLKELRTRLQVEGLEVLDPWELGEELIANFHLLSSGLSVNERISTLHNLNIEIGRINQKAIDRADILVAGLDGPDVDSGTASEIGYAFGRGKLILGYRGDFRLTGENEAARVNIQVQYWIEQSGGQIVTRLSDLSVALRSAKEKLMEHNVNVKGVSHDDERIGGEKAFNENR